MPKHLGEPILVTAPAFADRYDITAYSVTVGDPAIDIAYACGRTNDDATLSTVAERTKHVPNGAELDAAMAQATANIVGTVLTAAVQAQLLSVEAATAIAAAIAQNTTLARDAYYAGTRDALYGLL